MIMEINEISVRNDLTKLADEKYNGFASSLIPNIDNLIGVRIPVIRKYAKTLIKENNFVNIQGYINKNNEIYFEEVMLKCIILGNLQCDIDSALILLQELIPKINNWSTCDSLCKEFKMARYNKEKVWNFLQPYLLSNKVYYVRVALVMILSYFVDDEHIDLIFDICNNISKEDYYVKMAVAWLISMCFVKLREKTFAYLNNNALDKFTHNKSLQKIRESLKVDSMTKKQISLLKRI